MNRLGKQLLTRALSSVKATSQASSNRLYSVVNSSANNSKWLRNLQIHELTNRHLVLLGAPRRFQHQKASVDEEALAQEGEELQTQKQNVIQGASDAQVAEFFREHQIFVQGLQDPRIQKPIFDFGHIQLPGKLAELMNKLAFSKPTPIQAQSLPILLSDRDLIGIAQTGSGKTLAYLLPAFKKFFSIHRNYFSYSRDEEYDESKLSQKSGGKLNPKVLVLAPTRELALQIFDVVKQFRMFKTICLYGGSDRRKQVHFLETQNPLVVVSTPGRLKDLLDAEFVSLKEIEYLVVDEADRMLDMGFEPQISYLINKCPRERQTMMFSASWPDEVKSLVHKYLRPNHAFLSIGGTKLVANHNIEQHVSVCHAGQRADKLGEILEKHQGERMIVFANTKIGCQRVSGLIHGKYRVRSAPLHGDMSQAQRERTVRDFKSDDIKVLCATNVAARGLDIDNVGVVINYDMDDDIETYVHRIGRTGRKQNKGHAYSFFIDHEKNALARGLVEIMQESKNEVPQELQEIAAQNPRGQGKKYNRYGSNGGGGGGYNNDNRNYQNYQQGGNRGGSRGGSKYGGGTRKYNNNYYD